MRTVFLKEGGWRHARSLYLIGGFARDEGTCGFVNGRLRVYNDLDFLVIVRRRCPLRMLALHRIGRRLNDGRFGCQIDLVVVPADELADPPPTLLQFDMQQHYVWLWGQRVFESGGARRLTPDRLSPGDALQLLLNRQASLMIGLSLLRQDPVDGPYLQVQLSKPLFAMMSAVLIAERRYVVPVRRQLELIEADRRQRRSEPLWQVFQDEQVMDLLRVAVRFKHEPKPEHFVPFEENIETIARSYHDFVKTFVAHHYGLPTDGPIGALVDAFCAQQQRRLDILSPPWWACWWRSRSVGLRARRPTYAAHPQVDVYAAHLLWMTQHVTGRPQPWRAALPAARSCPQRDELDVLIDAWKVSGYGCAIR